ncbi:hypothetical protein [Streptacidiphilus fuscans]|uniref:Uncharacterized protein n=1 Tax=Streptacidiphilus fuscans TaxID=2789292 RepID=A0A931B186_9ACTN|nr:hypothetical protein [Streptacidiphilus fuscans]MBF9068441.1 hypothetical protein [Streptacidiphilus fuscans]
MRSLRPGRSRRADVPTDMVGPASTRTTLTRAAVGSLLAAAVLLGATACGGGSGSSAGSAPASGTAASAGATPNAGQTATLQQEQAKVNAAQSAANAADSDAANDPTQQ